MATSTHTTRLTYDDLMTLQERPEHALHRLELIDGELYVSPAPNLFHQRVSSNLMYALEQHIRPKRLGVAYAAPVTVRFADGSVVQPDILYLSRERAELLSNGIVTGAPDLVIEILSRSTKRVDVTKKKALYERFGVPEYWILNHEIPDASVFALIEGRYVPVPVEDGIARSLVIPGFEISLADLFESFP